jgi:ABC-2 type transport system permease protein
VKETNAMQSTMSVNWLGLATLYQREVWRFLKVWNQTLIAPMVTGLLFLAIFSLALGGHMRSIHGLPFDLYIAPGLIIMAVVQNSFANTSSSLMLSKMQGTIIDLLMPPLSPLEITTALVLGGVTRGMMVGLVTYLAMWAFLPLGIAHPALLLYYLVMASTFMALLGMIGGLWAHTFDQMAAMSNYVITPLTFLSGTFYSVQQLPGFWHAVSQYNPFFFIIDGTRYAMTGVHDGNIATGMAALAGLNLLLWMGAAWIIRSGYRLKA